MEHVTGIGGVFFRAKNPETLSAWYEEMFGISRARRHGSNKREPLFSRHFRATPSISATQARHG
jgi:hypothetical protein